MISINAPVFLVPVVQMLVNFGFFVSVELSTQVAVPVVAEAFDVVVIFPPEKQRIEILLQCEHFFFLINFAAIYL